MEQYLESLGELSADIRASYEDECQQELESSGGAKSKRVAVRDIAIDGKELSPSGVQLTRKDVLETWQDLVTVIQRLKIFCETAPVLERLFLRSMYVDNDHWKHINTLLDLMIETVESNSEPQTEECFLTLIEILSSYCSNWEISEKLQNRWIDLGFPVETDIGDKEFRNRAYSVLMSLFWVPNSQNLHWVCEVEEEAPEAENPVPPAILSIFHQIRRSSPLPRRDCVHRLLSRLNEGSHTTLAISSLQDKIETRNSLDGVGMGKTTLAALVASHATVRSKFCILWLRLSHNQWNVGEKSYYWYTSCLDKLCEQLCVKPEWPRPVFEMEPPSVRRKREEEQMFHVKEKMKKIIQSQSKDILLVLDDAWDDQEIEWFRFQENQSIIVTTKTHNLSVSWTLEIDVLTEAEALELFLTESDYPPTHVLSTSLEAKSTVQRCGYHPLTIRTVARWFRLKQVTAGVVKGLEELNSELSACFAKLRHSSHYANRNENLGKFLTEVLNIMLSPVLATDGQPTKLMKLCLSSMAVVFEDKVPLEAVHLLWGELLHSDPSAVNELGANLTENQLRKRVRFVSEALVSLGLLSVTAGDDQSNIEIHHPMQKDYALSILKEMEFMGEYSQEETVQSWHEAYAEAYLAKKVECDRNGVPDILKGYSLKHLVSHMLKGKMWSKVVVLLKDERFLRDRFDFMGLEEGTRAHVNDCRRFQQFMNNTENVTLTTLSIYRKMGAILRSHEDGEEGIRLEAANALNCIALALAEGHFWTESISRFKDASKLLENIQDHPATAELSTTILYCRGSVHLANLEPTRCLKQLKNCMKMIDKNKGFNSDDQMKTIWGLSMLKMGDALLLMDEYREAMKHYVQALDALYKDASNNRVEIGSALLRKGRLHQMMGQAENAKRVLKECVQWKREIGESSGEVALALSYLGDVYSDETSTQEAIRSFESASTLFEAFSDEIEQSDLDLVAGKTAELNGDYDTCVKHFNEVVEFLEQAPDERKIRTCYDFRCIARIFERNGGEDKALEAYDMSIAASEDADGSLERASTLFYKGTFLVTRGSMKNEALKLLESSLNTRITKLGPCECVIATLQKIASIHRSNGDTEETANTFSKIRDCTEVLYGDDSEKVAPVLYELAELKESTNKGEALALFGQCLDIQKRKLGQTHPEVANTLQKIGFIHASKENFHKAYDCYAGAVDIQQIIFSDSDPRLAETYHMLGSAARKGGDPERALPFLLDAFAIREEHGYQRQICETLQEIGHVHRQLKDPTAAISCYEKSIGILSEAYGDMDEKVGDMYLSLGHAKRDNDQTTEAVQCYVKALNIQKDAHASGHPRLAAPLRSLGVLNFQIGNLDEAVHCLDEYVRIKELNKQIEAMEYILTLEILGDIHRAKGNYEEADKYWSMALQIFSRNNEFIAQHPGLGQSLSNRLSNNSNDEGTGLFQGLMNGITRGLSEEVMDVGVGRPLPAQEEENVIQQYIFME